MSLIVVSACCLESKLSNLILNLFFRLTGDWGKKPMLMGSTVTQVFHIPVEERKDQISPEQFGGSNEKNHNLIKNVMEKTGAKIEMSSSKDRSLTFLISGKQDTVLKARRELLVQFQTQASHSIGKSIF